MKNEVRLVFSCVVHENDFVKELYDNYLNVLVRLKRKILVVILVLSVVVVTKVRLKRRPLQEVTSDIVFS
jgi:hypothetical protein